MKKPTNAVILQCIDTLHSPTYFSSLKCHHQEVNYDPAETRAIVVKIRYGWKLYIAAGGVIFRISCILQQVA
jgi:hypothetical protein